MITQHRRKLVVDKRVPFIYFGLLNGTYEHYSWLIIDGTISGELNEKIEKPKHSKSEVSVNSLLCVQEFVIIVCQLFSNKEIRYNVNGFLVDIYSYKFLPCRPID